MISGYKTQTQMLMTTLQIRMTHDYTTDPDAHDYYITDPDPGSLSAGGGLVARRRG